MSFGNFLDGFARSLGSGVEAGEYIQGAIDRKRQRKEGQRVFKEQEAKNAASVPPAPINGKPAAGPPKPVGSGTLVATQPGQSPPPAAVQPPPIAAPQQPQQNVAYVPAQRLGAQAPSFAVQFPPGIAAQYGVGPPMQRFPGDQYQYPYPMY